MDRSKINELPQVLFQVTSEGLPAGRTCCLEEQEGGMNVYIRQGHAAPALCVQLNQMHRVLMGVEGRWAQTWYSEDVDNAQMPPSGLGVARAEWRIVPPSLLPLGILCFPLEKPGEITWAIRRGLATPQLCAELNRLMADVLDDGLWLQRWDVGTS